MQTWRRNNIVGESEKPKRVNFKIRGIESQHSQMGGTFLGEKWPLRQMPQL